MAFTRKTQPTQSVPEAVKAAPAKETRAISATPEDRRDVWEGFNPNPSDLPDFLKDGFDPLKDLVAPAADDISAAELALKAAVAAPVVEKAETRTPAEIQAAEPTMAQRQAEKEAVADAEWLEDPEVEEVEEPAPEVEVAPAKESRVAIGDNSAAMLVDRVHEYRTNIDESYVKLARVLREMREMKLYRKMGYTDQEKFFPAVLRMSYRQGMFYVAIADTFDHTGVSDADLIAMGWSKAKEFKGVAKPLIPALVARVLKDDWGFDFTQNFFKLNRAFGADRFERIVRHVEDKDLDPAAIETYVASLRKESGVANTDRASVTFSFTGEQRDLMDAAVDVGRAKFSAGWDKDRHGEMPKGLVLARILGEWSIQEKDASLTLDEGIATLEAMFGVKLKKE